MTALAATLVLAALIQSPLELARTAERAVAAFGYASNVHFCGLASDYFNGNVHSNATLHMWSLGVEEQFYLVWPWILL